VTLWPDFFIEGLGWFKPRLLGQLDDLADTVSQVEFDRDLIALGELLLRQDIGICHGERPGLTLQRPECEGVLGLIDAYDCASYKGGRRFTGEGAQAQQQAKETDCHYCELVIFHVAPPTGANKVVSGQHRVDVISLALPYEMVRACSCQSLCSVRKSFARD
jgi:hypothetical protein